MGGPIRFVDIHAFEAVEGVKLAPWELRAIRAGDRMYLKRESDRLQREH